MKILLAFLLLLSQLAFAQTESGKPKRFTSELLTKEQLADCKRFRESATPHELGELYVVNAILVKFSGLPMPPGKPAYIPPALMTREDVIGLLGEPDRSEPGQISYKGSKSDLSGLLIFQIKDEHISLIIIVESR